MSYDPVQYGVPGDTHSVSYVETNPSAELAPFVHRFWELRTNAPLHKDFSLHLLPDASIHVAFNIRVGGAVGLSAVGTHAALLPLGTEFHFVGIRLRPGVWQGGPREITRGVISRPYDGELPLAETRSRLDDMDLSGAAPLLSDLVGNLLHDTLIAENPLTNAICAQVEDLRSVADMAKLVGLSARQLQRVLTQSTGFQPHDFLKILRLQYSFRDHYLTHYADQPHFIRCFRSLTGYTPTRYRRVFGV